MVLYCYNKPTLIGLQRVETVHNFPLRCQRPVDVSLRCDWYLSFSKYSWVSLITASLWAGSTTTLPMSWWMESRWTWASGIQQDKKIMTDSAHCHTHRRYWGGGGWKHTAMETTFMFQFLSLEMCRWRSLSRTLVNIWIQHAALRCCQGGRIALSFSSCFLSFPSGCFPHLLLACESGLVRERPCQGEQMQGGRRENCDDTKTQCNNFPLGWLCSCFFPLLLTICCH